MMHNLLPEFILENYKNNNFEGSFDAVTMFMDVSGFTSMTEKLMKGEKEGAEILSKLLLNIFKPAVKKVYSNNGFISNYAGDSFTSFFLKNENTPISEIAENALNCGISIINHFKNSGLYKTKYGNFTLTVRIGISFGNTDWAILGNEFKSFYFRGEGINGCTEVQTKADKNEIVFDSKFAKLLNSELKFRFEKQKYCYKVKDYSSNLINIEPKEIINDSPLAKQIFSKKFFTDTVLSASQNGEFRNVVSVFISFKSELSKDLINKLFNVIIESINHYNGYLKDIDFGDKGGILVCYFGAPVSNEDDINRAVSFIKSVIFRVSKKEFPMKLKFGVTYGRVFTGFIGSEERTQYTVVGDKVNLASRFVTEANDNEVWISIEVFNLIKNNKNFYYSGKYKFKGFTKLIPVYIFKFESLKFPIKEPNLISKNKMTDLMIGRDEDLKNLNLYVDKYLKENTPGIINISGEAGIGKTNLIREFKNRYIQNNNISWLYCYTSEISKFPLSPFKYLLKNFFKQTSSNTHEENKRIFNNILDIINKQLENISIENKYVENNTVQVRSELERTRSVLAAMIDIRWDNSFFEKLDPTLRLENFLFAFCNLIIAECLIQPVIIEIEDIHWLDKESASLINMLVNNIPDIPLVIITTTRQNFKMNNILPNIKGSKFHFNIELKYFQIENIKNLAFKFLNKQIDDTAAQHILESTNGNPYFAEQLILDYKERNFWKMENNSYCLIDYDKKILPSTINNVLISRFDKLPEDVKTIVQSASVLGREFEERVLKDMFNNSEEIGNHIRIAEEENIWYSGSNGKYKFIHALLKESLYTMQMNSALSELHLRAAESIRNLNYKKLSQNLLEQIAYHLGIGNGIVNHLKEPVFLKSNLKDNKFSDAVNEYIRLQCNIADEYKKEYQNDNALEIYNLIEKILKKQTYTSELIEILFKKAEILCIISKWEEAKNIINSAKSISLFLDDKYKMEISNKYLANLLFLQNEYDKSLALYEGCRKYFNSNNKSIELLITLNGIGKIYLEKGDYKNSFNVFKEQLKTALKFNADDYIVKAYFNLGNNYRRIGEYKDSLYNLKKVYKYFKKIKDENFLADLYIEEAIVNFYMGENNEALNKFKKALKVFSKIGNRRGYYRTLGNMGNILIVKDEYKKAFEIFEQQIKYYRTVNDLSGLSVSYFNFGVGLMAKGKFNDALNYFKLQSDIDKKLKRTDRIANSYSNMAQIYNQTGQYSRALKLHYKQLLIDKKSSNKEGILRATVNIADVYKDSGDIENALKFYKKGCDLSVKYSIKKDFEYIVKNYSEALTQKGKLNESIKICSDFLSEKKSNKIICTDVFNFIILKNNLFLELNKITGKKLKLTEKHSVLFRNLIKKMESLINNFDNKEYAAFAYLDLFDLNNLLIDNKIELNFKNHFNRISYSLFKELYSNIPQKIYSDKLEELK